MRSAALLLVVALLVVALPAAAATVTIAPASPNTAAVITATTDIPTICLLPAQVTVAGNVIKAVHVPQAECVTITGPLAPSVVPLGTLPAGTYLYELYAPDAQTRVATTTFIVAAGSPPPAVPAVPLNDSYGLAFLSVLFVLAGAMAVGRVA